jgi:phosphate transport system protein
VRDIYHDELDDVGRQVIAMTKLVAVAIGRATHALLNSDLALADYVITDDARIDALRAELDERVFTLVAQQQPVATDLRVLLSTIHLVSDLERMGDLAHHIAKIARLRYPEPAVPVEAREVISRMGAVARSLVNKVSDVVEGRDVELAEAIEHEDDTMDALRRQLFEIVLAPSWARGTEAAIDLTLLGRYYERYADHAVAVARQTIYIVTGQHPGRPVRAVG